MRLQKIIALVACGLAIPVFAEQQQRVVTEFFRGPVATRQTRLRSYRLEDQYKIFRYGNDHIHPPAIGLADPIAERGASAVDFLVTQLEAASDALSVRDIALLFERMSLTRSYDVGANSTVMSLLEEKVSALEDAGARDTCEQMLRRIRQQRAARDPGATTPGVSPPSLGPSKEGSPGANATSTP
jgi:hypothetical protein